jgi:hypothetical protein
MSVSIIDLEDPKIKKLPHTALQAFCNGYNLGGKPEIGMRCTLQMWSDRYPYTIVGISKNGHKLTIRKDKYKLKPSTTAYDNNWIIEENLKGRVEYAYKKKNGLYFCDGSCVLLGVWEHYYDPCF